MIILKFDLSFYSYFHGVIIARLYLTINFILHLDGLDISIKCDYYICKIILTIQIYNLGLGQDCVYVNDLYIQND